MSEEYIRRQDAITAACKGFCHIGVRCPDEPCMEQTKYLRELPSADVVQVRHARWERYSGITIRCSRCEYVIHDWRLSECKYCPHCGARMDAQGEE